MTNFREERAWIAYAYGSNFINKQEFVLLCDCQKSTNPQFPYWNYDRFYLGEKSNGECKAEFRFHMEDIYWKIFHTAIYFSFIPIPCRVLTAFSVGWTHSVRHGTVEGRFLNENRLTKLKSNVKDMPLMRYLNYLAKIPEASRELWKLNSRPPVSKTPANRSHQRRRLWREADKCSERHAQWACHAI